MPREPKFIPLKAKFLQPNTALVFLVFAFFLTEFVSKIVIFIEAGVDLKDYRKTMTMAKLNGSMSSDRSQVG